MNLKRENLLLYAVTDRKWLKKSTLAQEVEKAICAGVTFVQLREKALDFDALVNLGKELHAVTMRYNVPLVLDDAIEAALACGAEGVHIGQNDCPAKEARRLLGTGKVLGVTAKTPEQARLAEAAGADYLGSGAVFGSTTKQNAAFLPLERLKEICQSVSIPVVAIGGINEETITQLSGTGIAGAAIVSGLFAQPDITAAALNLQALCQKVVNKK